MKELTKIIELLFVGRPFNIFLVSTLLLVGYFLMRILYPESTSRSWPLIATICGWLLFTGWEWLIQVKTPEANIRVDLLIIVPVLGLLTIFAVLKAVLSLFGK